MTRASALAVVLGLLAAGCGSSSPTTPSAPVKPTFTAQLSPANEVPPVTNAESVASGNATIVFDLTKDAAGNITSGNVTFTANCSGFPTGSTVTAAHIHPGAAGVAGGVLLSAGINPSTVTLTPNGAGSFTTTVPGQAGDLTNIMNNPAGFYFNIHTALNGGGVMRGQLVRTQ